MTMNISDDADLHITIYDIGGKVVRRLNLGHQMAGYYMNREKAARWDGRSEIGELASSGPYFYQLKAWSYQALPCHSHSERLRNGRSNQELG